MYGAHPIMVHSINISSMVDFVPGSTGRLRKFVASHGWLQRPAREGILRWRSSRVGHRYRRKKFGMSYFKAKLTMLDHWSSLWTEDDNFYYDLTTRNRSDLACLVSLITGEEVQTVDGYIREIADDLELREHIKASLVEDSSLRDVCPGFGRREGWYAFIRTLKPAIVVETGVHHGVGACVITAALMRNAEEGHRGYYFGTDIDLNSGFLLKGKYREYGEILFGDSIKSIDALQLKIDIFINDSDHSAEYEWLEYKAVESKLSECSLVLGDNSHVTSALNKWSRAQGRPFAFFKEEPREHWYPGAGIGVSPTSVPLISSNGKF